MSEHIPSSNINVIIPAKNEAESLGSVLTSIRRVLPDSEIIVVNDGSEDNTADIAESLADITISHPHSLGNGASIKAGARAAKTRYALARRTRRGEGAHGSPASREEASR